MKILITGGAGFIGSNLIKTLLTTTSHFVINLDKLSYPYNLKLFNSLDQKYLKRYKFFKVNLCDYDNLSKIIFLYKPNLIMHLAAESHVDKSIDDPNIFIDSNIIGTKNLLEISRAFYNQLSIENRKIFKFHHISTDEVFGSLDENGKFNESTPYDPRSPYSASKAASDHLVRSWFHTYNLPTVVSNCSNNYGPLQYPEKLIPKVILSALNHNPIEVYGDGSNIRDWIYVDDHIEALIKVLFESKPGKTYCIGGSSEKSNIELVNIICNKLDMILPNKASYKELIKFVKDRPGHDFRYAIDSTCISNDLNWQPKHTFEEGIVKTIKWYIENKNWFNENGKNSFNDISKRQGMLE